MEYRGEGINGGDVKVVRGLVEEEEVVRHEHKH
jgi:hypothetical protein